MGQVTGQGTGKLAQWRDGDTEMMRSPGKGKLNKQNWGRRWNVMRVGKAFDNFKNGRFAFVFVMRKFLYIKLDD